MTTRVVTNAGLLERTARFARVLRVAVPGDAPAAGADRVLATVLFTDVVSSTERAALTGDRAWADVLHRHLAAARATIAGHGGETIKTTGDGVLALFAAPAQAVRCAERLVADAGDLGLELRSGLHAGEVVRRGHDVAGIAVHLAARVMGLAGGGEVLVSRTVRDLVIGSDLSFADRGEHALKGIPDPWEVHALA